EGQILAFHALQLGRRLLVLTPGRDFFAPQVKNLGDGHETANAGDINNQAALVVVNHSCLEQFAILVLLFCDAPLPFGVRASKGENGMALWRFWLDDIYQHLVIEVQFSEGAVATGWKFFCREYPLRL